jgi:hypothetical protein
MITAFLPPHEEFERNARPYLEAQYGVSLPKGTQAGIPKEFDYLDPLLAVAGDAKFYTLGYNRPSGKLATICETVWLLEHTSAPQLFMLFGNDVEVPTLWLLKYGGVLRGGFTFWFLDLAQPSPTLTRLWP